MPRLGAWCFDKFLFVAGYRSDIAPTGATRGILTSRAHEYKDTDPIGFTARTEAWELCKKDILGRLKAPASAEFVDEDHGYKRVFIEDAITKVPKGKRKKFQAVDKRLGVKAPSPRVGSVDTQNSFGAKLRTFFDCRFL